jgi:polyisoprenoid-binding protein YceI
MNARKTITAFIAIAFVVGGGNALADTVPYQIDPVHSGVDFSVRHMVVTNVKGAFDELAGHIHFNASDVTASSVEVTIQAASINTGNEKRDNHLRSPDFLAVEDFPTITFKSSSIRRTDDGFVAVGDLTIRDVTRTVEIPFEVHGPVTSPWGQQVIGASGELTINRMDYGANWNKAIEAGGVVVSEDVKIELNVEASKAES